jgi:WXG100 family type VII secretion target
MAQVMANELEVTNYGSIHSVVQTIVPQRQQMMATLEEIQNKVVNISGTWEGQASLDFRIQFSRLYKDFAEATNIVAEYINDIQDIVDIYQQNEGAITAQKTHTLVTDVFQV